MCGAVFNFITSHFSWALVISLLFSGWDFMSIFYPVFGLPLVSGNRNRSIFWEATSASIFLGRFACGVWMDGM